MEYRNDKRTRNLTLRDIRIGDWVQVWNKTTERYSPPRKITQICDDGAVYLEGNEEGRPALWVENIKNVDALEITRELLEGFGFEVIPRKYTEDGFDVLWCGRKICEFYEPSNYILVETTIKLYKYCHELITYMYDTFPLSFQLEWKGVQS